MRVGVANGQNTAPNLTPTQLGEDFREMGRACDAIGYSELGEHRDHQVLRDVLDPDKWWHVGHSECAVSARRAVLEVIDHRTVWVLDKGKAGVNPRRPLELATVEHRKRDRLPPFFIAATHWTNGAFSNPGQSAEEWRDDSWQDCWEHTRDEMTSLLEDGLSGIFLGDLNARRVPRFTRRQEWLPGTKGIDKGATLEAPAGLGFKHPTAVRVIALHSKHDGKVWSIGLRP